MHIKVTKTILLNIYYCGLDISLTIFTYNIYPTTGNRTFFYLIDALGRFNDCDKPQSKNNSLHGDLAIIIY